VLRVQPRYGSGVCTDLLTRSGQTDQQTIAYELDSAAGRLDEASGRRRAEVLQVVAEDDGPDVFEHGRDRNRGSLRGHLNLLEAAVAKRAPGKSRQPALGRVPIDEDRRTRPTGDRLLPQATRGGLRQLERVRLGHIRRVATGLDPRCQPEVVQDLRQLAGGGLDHLDVTVGRLPQLVLEQRVREAGHGREGRPQVVTGERHEAGEAVVGHGNGTISARMDDLTRLLDDDLQASLPEVRLGLSRAGVTGVEKAIRISYAGREQQVAAEIECTVDLDPAQKGVHMSRFPELFEEAIDEVVIGEAFLVEVLAEHIATHIVERQQALRAQVRIAARYPIERTTPVTGLATQEMVSLIGIAAASQTGVRRLVGVEASGINACPCAQGLVRGRASERLLEAGFDGDDVERILELVPLATHNQRGRGTLYVGTRASVNAEQLVEMVAGSMSAPVYELLKRPDELFVVEHAHLQPRFVEDSVRVALKSVLDAYPGLADDDFVFSRQVNLETIHTHDVLAERYGTVGELRRELDDGAPLEHHTELSEWLRRGPTK
jgi:GTP cyclohydrolase IV